MCKETSAERRKRLDHERYLRERSERLERNRQYYREHRDELRAKRKLKYREQVLSKYD